MGSITRGTTNPNRLRRADRYLTGVLAPLVRRAHDPLLVAAEAEGEAQARFRGHGDRIDRWIAPLFPDDDAAGRRIRRAACLLADVGWRANPDFWRHVI